MSDRSVVSVRCTGVDMRSSKGIRYGHESSAAVVRAIDDLRAALVSKYGEDYAFTVMGGSHLLGASNASDGEVFPVTERSS